MAASLRSAPIGRLLRILSPLFVAVAIAAAFRLVLYVTSGGRVMATLTVLAEIIGFVVLALLGLLAIMTAVAAVNDCIRMRFPAWDRYLYDETARWNARCRQRRQRRMAKSAPPPSDEDASD